MLMHKRPHPRVQTWIFHIRCSLTMREAAHQLLGWCKRAHWIVQIWISLIKYSLTMRGAVHLPLAWLKEILTILHFTVQTMELSGQTGATMWTLLHRNVHQVTQRDFHAWYHTFIVITLGAQRANPVLMETHGMKKPRIPLATKLLLELTRDLWFKETQITLLYIALTMEQSDQTGAIIWIL
jgi:hypothetical protein